MVNFAPFLYAGTTLLSALCLLKRKLVRVVVLHLYQSVTEYIQMYKLVAVHVLVTINALYETTVFRPPRPKIYAEFLSV